MYIRTLRSIFGRSGKYVEISMVETIEKMMVIVAIYCKLSLFGVKMVINLVVITTHIDFDMIPLK